MVEHLEKGSAMHLIAEAKGIDREKVIINPLMASFPKTVTLGDWAARSTKSAGLCSQRANSPALGFKCETVH